MVLTLIAAAIVLSILIITHELGHFSAAKLLGVRVLRFSLGLGPRILGFKRGDTDYALSLIPFGGYVKLAGMEESETEGKKDEFSSKRPAAKIWIILSGPIANAVLAFVLYLVITAAIGTSILDTTKVGHVESGSAAFDAGIQEYDQILMVGYKAVHNWNEVVEEIARESRGANVKVRRDGEELWLVMEPSNEVGISPLIDPVVGRVQKASPAQIAGLRSGDTIVAINGNKVERWEDIIETVHSAPDVPLQIDWVRGGQLYSNRIVPKSQLTVEDGRTEKIGVIGIHINVSRERLGAVPAFVESGARVVWVSEQILLFLGKLITGNASLRMVGGPIFIAKMAGETAKWGVDSLLNFMAFVSINLFIISLFPIPVLDGGQIVYYLTEAVRGASLSVFGSGR